MQLKQYILLGLILSLGYTASAQDSPPVTNLTAEVNEFGAVVLKWNTPTGYFPSEYRVKRGYITPDVTLAQFYGPTTHYTDWNVVSGVNYSYAVITVYPDGKFGRAFVDITVLPRTSGLAFESTPVNTALVGETWVYKPKVNHDKPQEIQYDLLTAPAGMEVRNIVGEKEITWTPERVGVYSVTLMATNWQTPSQPYAIQEFRITVGDQVGTVNGFVKTLTGDPLQGAEVRFWQIGGNGTSLTYTAVTDEDGNFELENVQAGRIYSFTKSPDESKYLSQYYINQPTLKTALERTLQEGRSLRYEYYLLPAVGHPTFVRGNVRNELGQNVEQASVTFIKKENFIHIGDTASIDNIAQSADPLSRASLADTIIYTDFQGNFSLELPAGSEYYTFVEKKDFIGSFYGEESNAMRARARHIDNSGVNMNFTLASQESTNHKLSGMVTSKSTGVSKQATIVIIDTEMKRGAGGGHTYRKYQSVVTDSNGVFQFDNLSEAPPSALLAIPMDTRLSPQFYHANGGRLNFVESEEITPNGTIQNVNFELQETMRNGIGSYYGRVVLRRKAERIPLPGALVFAQREATGEIAGYAVTDSVGVYAIPGLEPDNYVLFADHPEYSYRTVYSSAKPTRSMPVTMDYTDALDPDRHEDLNFYIDDLRYVVDVGETPLPTVMSLEQNYPNPFNPTTTIRYALPTRSDVTLRVVDAIGNEVSLLVNETQDAGSHSVTFSADGIPSGMYFYQLLANGSTLTRQMVLMK